MISLAKPKGPNTSGELLQLQGEFTVRGREEAAALRPPKDALQPDTHETQLRAHAERCMSLAQAKLDTATTEAGRALADLLPKLDEHKNHVEKLLDDSSLHSTIDAELSGERRVLVTAAAARLRQLVELNAYKARHGITESAQYPPSRIMHFAIVAVLALVETGVNAFFFENAQGLLGGLVVALGVAVMNMGGAMALGAGMRFKNLKVAWGPLLGWGCFVALLVFSPFCNAIFAAFRSQYQALNDPSSIPEMQNAFSAAWTEAMKIFVLDMRFPDFWSFILFGIGVILSLLAAYKGYTVDDRHPGYGKRDRALRACLAVEHEKQAGAMDKLKAVLQRRRSELSAAASEPMQLMSRASTGKRLVDLALVDWQTETEAVKRNHAVVLRAYREANLAVRATEPPAYFAQVPDLSGVVSRDQADRVNGDLDTFKGAADALRDQYAQRLSQELNKLQHDTARHQKETFEAFLADVEGQAKDVVEKDIVSMPALRTP